LKEKASQMETGIKRTQRHDTLAFKLTVVEQVENLFVIMAFARARATTLMPCLYVQIPFAVLGGWILNAHLPDHYAILGMCLIAICGLGSGLLALNEDKARWVPK
jgi:hypothetical protein